MLKPNSVGRLTLQKLNEYRDNSGLTERQYLILKRRYFDSDFPNMLMICTELNISTTTYSRELRKAIDIINDYNKGKVG